MDTYRTTDDVSVDARQLEADILNEDGTVHVAAGSWEVTHPDGTVVYSHPSTFTDNYTREG